MGTDAKRIRGPARVFLLRCLCVLVLPAGPSGCAKPEHAVVVYDRGREIHPTDAAADAIAAMAVELASASEAPLSSIVTTESWVALRQREVVVEVSFPKTREFRLSGARELVRADHVLIPLTRGLAEDPGNTSNVLFGQTAPFLHRLYARSGIPFPNGPDDLGREYGGVHASSAAVEPLRAAVAALGVDAPLPTPNPVVAKDPDARARRQE